MKLIIDADTGIDDGMALLQALHAHKTGAAEILAITTVAGNASIPNVIKNTYRLLELLGMTHIPVHVGSDTAMVVPYSQEGYHGNDGFNDVLFDSDPDTSRVSTESAVDAIRRLTKTHPGEITMVCLAPLTNLALAMKVDKAVATGLKEVVLMGGNVEGVGNASVAAEFNFHADPEAAHVVMDAAQFPITVVSWELCFKYLHISMKWRLDVLGKTGTKQADLFNRLEQVWFDNYDFDPDIWILCDQLAMAVALDRSIIATSRQKKAIVELSGHFSRGNMLLESRLHVERHDEFKTNVQIVDTVDEGKFQEAVLAAFSHQF